MPPKHPHNWIDQLPDLAAPLNFSLIAVTDTRSADHQDFFHYWLDTNQHGEMHYLANNIDVRLNPQKLLPHAQSIIVVADQYPAQYPGKPDPTPDQPLGHIARYAWGDDYHKTIKKRLFALIDQLKTQHPDAQFRAVVDTAPIFERQYAQRANLGWIGKHTLLINTRLGSYLLLGLILTTLDYNACVQVTDNRVPHFDPDEVGTKCAAKALPLPSGEGWGEGDHPKANDTDVISNKSHCGSCTRCIDACPTQCITPYSINASRCISYLTLEHRTEIPPDLHAPLGQWIAGCDICQQVCPFNQSRVTGAEQSAAPANTTRATGGLPASAPTPHHPAYTPRPPAPAIPLINILNWNEQDRRKAVHKSALKRVKLDMFLRNALIAAGNFLTEHRDDTLLQKIKTIAADDNEPPLVKNTAMQICKNLSTKSQA